MLTGSIGLASVPDILHFQKKKKSQFLPALLRRDQPYFMSSKDLTNITCFPPLSPGPSSHETPPQ